ncbi:aminofutalosine synthase MqnE [Desulfobacca acetoxidans]|uniref:Aminodeoxyfutalosine synthase n=1 Tax=Desulfobacca acetoxidans (strain ATCC 700848 / DSM 11109 / ASRB2) TaxID=880072 RepID=F2NJ95_DESAR|nr:aminofutalosine synthase MqnE [Desulfobacca acetoxidans]AEB09267.1 putative menaquinone biosynthesis protein [Desulfobacca acetoxidans DSM 11109]HAY21077.1 aminofutalosine synthase MqnE [Desulfobacterales bacterium]
MGGNGFFKDPNLIPIHEKVLAQKRLTFEDGLDLYRSTDLLGVGYLANIARERQHGNKAYYIINQHINYSNVCINGCKFCAFGKRAGDPLAYEMSLDDIMAKVDERLSEPVTEIHIVGGLHPNLPFSYYLDMLRNIKTRRPSVHLQAFTAVEIAHLASIADLSVADTLAALQEVGLGSLPGGGAEVFSPRIRQSLCAKKLPPEGWLQVCQTAHRQGLRTNATMLYGHHETLEERVDHLVKLRAAQDETGGFLTFIPLAFHSANTELAGLPETTGFDDLKNLAVARLILDNFPHIKAFWIMIGPKIAQLSLAFGADDIDGTVIEERITHMAGARTAQGLTRQELHHLIQEAGREPVERDTLYNVISH